MNAPAENRILGTLCKRGHDHEGTGKSLRYASTQACYVCVRENQRATQERKRKAKGASVSKPKAPKAAKPKAAKKPAAKAEAGAPPPSSSGSTIWPGFTEHVESFVDALRAGADALLAADDPRWQVLTGLAAVLETSAKRRAAK